MRKRAPPRRSTRVDVGLIDSAIQGPDCEVEHTCKSNPSQVGRQKPAGPGAESAEKKESLTDEEPKKDDLEESPTRSPSSEKEK